VRFSQKQQDGSAPSSQTFKINHFKISIGPRVQKD